MSAPTQSSDSAERAQQVHAALVHEHPNLAAHLPEPMLDKGLAHWHFRLPGTGWIARVPKQSQMGLAADANLAYQSACFTRAAPSGHAPKLLGLLSPSADLPRGALLVEEIVGRPARLPADLNAIMDALAAIHALPLPAEGVRQPLWDPASPIQALLVEIDAQAAHLDAAGLAHASRAGIDATLALVRAEIALARATPKRLIAFDAHPGNFLIRENGVAVLVDLEKARYGVPSLDIAHATLVTSTTWDLESSAVLNAAEVIGAYHRWTLALGGASAGDGRDWVLARAAMWLWSVTWCAKWRVVSHQPRQPSAHGEDWSDTMSEQQLHSHVRDRVDDYLSPQRVAFVIDELENLDRAFRV
ncbi:aminoglycoside phosphotransferase family protein [Ramlibacter sp.]|uniref:phosphotransferase family protein n=1 Tax=Ramlibacter sp. TaxID=1917967 RepID=UPI0017CBE6D0|nr:aminoglycoside phosphotransferase family protein [Ramlibacter sp.]MBA2675942.1 aminoglycoside phosphotransferase family protein [Ramlibacter sp.]